MERKPRENTRLWIVRIAFAGFFGFAIGSAPAHGESATLRPLKDSTLIENSAGSFANGSGPAIFAGRVNSSSDSRRRALLAFDVAGSIPPGSVVTSVSLTLHLSATNAGPVDVSLHRVLADWGEGASYSSGGGGATSLTGDSTWVHRFYDTDYWTSAGGDFDWNPHAVALVDQPAGYVWGSAAMVGDVQSWLDLPEGNFGWALVGDETRTQTVKRFDSREADDEASRPGLLVEFIPPCLPHPRGLGYWQLQCSSSRPAWAGGPEEPLFSEQILPCSDTMLANLGLAEEVRACEAILSGPPLGCGQLALRQLSVLVLNVCSGRLQTSCPAGVSDERCSSSNIGDRLGELSSLFQSGECRRASDCASIPE